METTIDFESFCKKYNICVHCQCFLDNPETVSRDMKDAINSEKFKSLADESNEFDLKQIVEPDWECSLCMGIWGLLHCQDFYSYMLDRLKKSGYQYKTVQICMWIPLTLRLRYKN